MPSYQYSIEVKYENKDWSVIRGEKNNSKPYMEGRFSGFKDKPGPRPAYRLVQTDLDDQTLPIKVLGETPSLSEVSVGMLAQSMGYQWRAFAMAASRALRDASYDVEYVESREPELAGLGAKFLALSEQVKALVLSADPEEED